MSIVYHIHKNGQADTRKPQRLSVGPILAQWDDGTIEIIAHASADDLRKMRRYQYQQLQIEVRR